MNAETRKGVGEEYLSEEEYTDTSVFNAEDIVKNIEAKASQRKSKVDDKGSVSRRQFEAMQEEKRLQEELRDLEDYEL